MDKVLYPSHPERLMNTGLQNVENHVLYQRKFKIKAMILEKIISIHQLHLKNPIKK